MAKVTIYSSDYCPYCSRAKALLQARGVTDVEEIVVDGKPDLRKLNALLGFQADRTEADKAWDALMAASAPEAKAE